MSRWRNFLDSLSTSGGHILVLCLIMAAAAGASVKHLPGSAEIQTGAFAAILALLRPSLPGSKE